MELPSCPSCSATLSRSTVYRVNGQPKCGGCRAELSDYDFHTSANASFDPILLHHNPVTGAFQFPGRNDEPAPPGFKSIEITSLRQADKWMSKVNGHFAEQMNDQRTLNRMAAEEKVKERREQIRPHLDKISPHARKLYEMACRRADQKREAKYAGRVDPNMNLQVFSRDANNRQGYRDPNGRETRS